MAEHIRIDEGIKRGKRKKNEPSVPEERPERGRMTPDLQPATVLDRYLDDEKIEEIARSCGVSRSRLNQWLLEMAPEQWRKTQIVRAITALERSKTDLDAAADPMELAKARERLRGAQWELERLFSRFFGQKQEIRIEPRIPIDESLGIEAAKLIEKIRCEVE